MRKEYVFILMFILMFSLVAGAGYNIVVPSSEGVNNDNGGGGGGGAVVTPVTTTNDSTTAPITGDVIEVGGEGEDSIADVLGRVFTGENSLWIWALIVGVIVIAGGVVLFVRRKHK